ncbi:MAG: ATP-dependent RNA helicase DeaD [Paraglaciecola sp.]
MATFSELGLSDKILKVLTEIGFETPSAIQEEAIPKLLEGQQNLIGLAQTGTGKTAAFGLPLLQRIDTSVKATQALVLAPTRELGRQIAEQLHTFSKYMDKVNVLAVYGGAPIHLQMKDLQRTQHVIIATPGRLIDLIKRKAVKLDQLQMMILDEADEMLNMGFKEELDKILSYTPEEKSTWLFSATMPHEIKRIVKKYMANPIEVKVNTQNQVNKNIEHQFAVVRQNDKFEALTRFMDMNPGMRGVVFCRTKRDTQMLAEDLMGQNYKADALHGDLSQPQRDRVMLRFKKHDLQLLIATDVAARGIDVNDLTHVFHFTLPDDNSYYTHRSGRTARAGKKGISIAFINGREVHRIYRIEKQLSISFAKVGIPQAEEIADIRIANWCQTILDKNPKGKISEELIEKVNVIFGNLTKEELIAKILMREYGKLQLGSTRDLNDEMQRGGGGGGSRGRSGGGGGRSRDRGDRRGGGGGGGPRFRGRREGGGGGRSRDSGGSSRDSGGGGGSRDSGGGSRDRDKPRKKRRY